MVAVWYADARVCFTPPGPTPGMGGLEDLESGSVRKAVAIDRRERTRSKGYVEPKEIQDRPLVRVIGMIRTHRGNARQRSSGKSLWGVQFMRSMQGKPLHAVHLAEENFMHEKDAHLFQLLVSGELDSGIWAS